MTGDEARSQESHFPDSAWFLDMYVTGEWVVDHVGRQKSLCQAQDSCSPVKPVFYPDCIRLDGQVPRIRYFFKPPHFIRKVSHPVPISSAIPWAISEEVYLCPSVKGYAQAGWVPNEFPYGSKALLLAPAMYISLIGQSQGLRMCA